MMKYTAKLYSWMFLEKRKKFHPFRAVRNIFRRAKRQGPYEASVASKKSRSTSELSSHQRREVLVEEQQQFSSLAPPYAAGLSVSHDSIFTPEPNNSSLAPDSLPGIQGSSLSIQHVRLKGFKDELFKRVRTRRDSDEEDDDIGLPQSPSYTSPTTADVLAQGLKEKPCHSRSTCSAGSLISMGSSENDDDTGGFVYTGYSSRMSHLDRRSIEFDGDPETFQPVPLNHNAALHKISVRPKRTHGLPKHRKLQQMAVASGVAILPSTPEVIEENSRKASFLTADLGIDTKDHPNNNKEEIEKAAQEESKSDDIMEEKIKFEIIEKPDEKESLTVSMDIIESEMLPDKPLLSPKLIVSSTSQSESLENASSSDCDTQHPQTSPSKGKSNAAELKLRHEIKQYSKRQLEQKEVLKTAAELDFDIIEVKECVPVSEEDADIKTEDLGEPNSKKINSKKDTCAEDETPSEVKESSSQNRCDPNVSQPVVREEEKFKSTITVSSQSFSVSQTSGSSGTTNVATLEKEFNKRVSPFRKSKEFVEKRRHSPTFNNLTDKKEELAKLDCQNGNSVVNPVDKSPSDIKHSNITDECKEIKHTEESKGCRKIEKEEKVVHKSVTDDMKYHMENREKENVNRQFRDVGSHQEGEELHREKTYGRDIPMGSKDDKKSQKEPKDDLKWHKKSTSEDKFHKDTRDDEKFVSNLNERRPSGVKPEQTKETKVPEVSKSRKRVPSLPQAVESSSDDLESPKVVLNKTNFTPLTRARSPSSPKSNRRNRQSIDPVDFSTQEFEGILKQRRSMTESEVLNRTVHNPIECRTEPEAGSDGRKLSVEIVPFNTRNKDPKYLPSKSPSGEEPREVSGNHKIPRAEERLLNAVELRRKLSFSAIEKASKESSVDEIPVSQVKHPIQFRIRRGKSLNEKSELAQKTTAESPEKPKIVRPKSQIFSKEKLATTAAAAPEGVSSVPEFMKIQLRSSREELDKGENTKPQKSSPLVHPVSNQVPHFPTSTSPPKTASVPQWEVKIGQSKPQRQASIDGNPNSLPPPTMASATSLESKSTISGAFSPVLKADKPAIKYVDTSMDKISPPPHEITVTTRRESNVENKENIGSTNFLVKDDVKHVGDSSESEDKQSPKSGLTSSGSMKEEVRRKSQSITGADPEPELFRVFARRSIKQRKSSKDSKDVPPVSTDKDSEQFSPSKSVETQENKDPQLEVVKAVPDNSVCKSLTVKAPVVETPKLLEKPKVALQVAKKQEEAKEPKASEKIHSSLEKKDKHSKDQINLAKHHEEKTPQVTQEQDKHLRAPIRLNVERKRYSLATSSVISQTPISRERKLSTPDNVYSKVEMGDTRCNGSPTSSPLLTVSIKPQQELTPTPRQNSSPVAITRANGQPSEPLADSLSQSPNNKDGSTPTWMQLAQQRREQRELKERKLCGSNTNSFVLDTSPNARPSRNSKVLDLVNNFQKLQTT